VKTSNTITGTDCPVILPRIAPNEVDYEVELVIVMGKECKNVAEADVDDYILGYTIGNDVSARDCQLKIDKQWARGKCFDTFAPIGPWIETELDGDSADISLMLNGETMQDSNTSDLVFSCRELVSFISLNMTLAPGSVIMTGTPEGVGFGRKPPVFLQAGDVMSATIAGIGTLRNQVVAE
jgi:2-keto-4-pentenoate hydratase/2-oxohepta-3-ene-1,7-dioic acid hydratase in catechol pathway